MDRQSCILYLLYKSMTDQEYFEKHKAEWLCTHENEWVWICSGSIEFFSTYEKAVEAAYAKGFDKEPIFIKQVSKTEIKPSVSGVYSWAV